MDRRNGPQAGLCMDSPGITGEWSFGNSYVKIQLRITDPKTIT